MLNDDLPESSQSITVTSTVGEDSRPLNDQKGQSPKKDTLKKGDPFLADEASGYLLSKLSEYDNTVSDDHETALRGLMWLAEQLVKGTVSGRFRYGLPCGMGKTTGVRAFLRTLAHLNLPYPVIVACSKVEQLCALKRALIKEDGISPSLVGLMHSYVYNPERALDLMDGYASELSEGHNRQFLLVTHANVKAGKIKDWMKGRENALMFFDESLIVSEALTLPLLSESSNSLSWEVGGLVATAEHYPNLQQAASWAKGAVAALVDAASKHENDEVRLVKLPHLDPDTAAQFRILRMISTQELPNLSLLLDPAERNELFRVFSNREKYKALVSYTITVPNELQNVIVLDASDPIRELVHHDGRMQRAEDAVPMLAKFKDIPGGMASIKRNDRVRVFFANEAGGREAMRKEFEEGASARPIEKLVRLVKANPDKSFLVFTYKDRDGTEYIKAIFNALRRAGINPLERIEEGKPRVCVLTWGMETASNDYKHCDVVVLLGVIFQPQESIAGAFLGQVDDIKSPRMHSLLKRLVFSECVHAIYQAANRGSMRVVDTVEGKTQARACDLYVIHSDAHLRDKIDCVMPGATWHPWKEPGEDMKATDVTMLIVEKLKELKAMGMQGISSRSLKKEVAPTVPSKTWKRARDKALAVSMWTLRGATLVAPLEFQDETEA